MLFYELKKTLTSVVDFQAEVIMNYHVGETVLSLQKTTLIPGGSESLVYTTLSGGIGILVPFTSHEVSKPHLNAAEPLLFCPYVPNQCVNLLHSLGGTAGLCSLETRVSSLSSLSSPSIPFSPPFPYIPSEERMQGRKEGAFNSSQNQCRS